MCLRGLSFVFFFSLIPHSFVRPRTDCNEMQRDGPAIECDEDTVDSVNQLETNGESSGSSSPFFAGTHYYHNFFLN